MSETITVEQDFSTGHSNIMDGLTIDFGDGHTLVVPPHSQRIYLEAWGNGFLDVLFYQEPVEGEDESDRIHLMIHGFDGYADGWILNVEDAIAMIRGLSAGIQHAIAHDVPTKPVSQPPAAVG